MSWQEKIERHKQEQAQTQSEAQKMALEKQERQKRENVEKIKPLLQVIGDLRCREMLTQIRDEVWKLGEVTVSPDLDRVTHGTPIEAKAVLKAEWGETYNIPHWADSGGGEGFCTHDEILEIIVKSKALSDEITVGLGKGPQEVGNIQETILDQNTCFWLEKKLIEDCTKRKGSFDEVVKSAAKKIEDIPKRNLENWYSANWKMLGFWEKLKWILRDK